jgi:hypothetical protein
MQTVLLQALEFMTEKNLRAVAFFALHEIQIASLARELGFPGSGERARQR